MWVERITEVPAPDGSDIRAPTHKEVTLPQNDKVAIAAPHAFQVTVNMAVFIHVPFANKSLITFEKEKYSTFLDVEKALLVLNEFPQGLIFKLYNGKTEICPDTRLSSVEGDVVLRAAFPLVGGKGGFGSMLRAIGAQIEKTTNREACRDLSGRRLRDINEEKRLKEWVSKQADREREKEEKKKKKLERLLAEPKHEFHDPEYETARANVLDKVHDAIEEGLKGAKVNAGPSQKRKANEEAGSSKKQALWLGVDEEELSDSDSNSDMEPTKNESPTVAITAVRDITLSHEENNSAGFPCTSDDAKSPESQPNEVTSEEEKPQTAKDSNPATESTVQLTRETPEVRETSNNQAQSGLLEQLPPPTEKPADPVLEDVDLESYVSVSALEQLGLQTLKLALQKRSLKCGGTLQERAARLWSVRGLTPDQYDPLLLAKPSGKKH
nr:EOG090X0OE5 [Triops cancriformis]